MNPARLGLLLLTGFCFFRPFAPAAEPPAPDPAPAAGN